VTVFSRFTKCCKNNNINLLNYTFSHKTRPLTFCGQPTVLTWPSGLPDLCHNTSSCTPSTIQDAVGLWPIADRPKHGMANSVGAERVTRASEFWICWKRDNWDFIREFIVERITVIKWTIEVALGQAVDDDVTTSSCGSNLLKHASSSQWMTQLITGKKD